MCEFRTRRTGSHPDNNFQAVNCTGDFAFLTAIFIGMAFDNLANGNLCRDPLLQARLTQLSRGGGANLADQSNHFDLKSANCRDSV